MSGLRSPNRRLPYVAAFGGGVVGGCSTSQDEIEEMEILLYRELVGALAWLALGTRPDIAFASQTSVVARTISHRSPWRKSHPRIIIL